MGSAGDQLDLGNNERIMLKAMLSDSERPWTMGEILSATDWEDQVFAAGAGKTLEEAGLLPALHERHTAQIAARGPGSIAEPGISGAGHA